jgi:ATP/maltotriose-dependent transcriptional regulator MalT
VARAIRLLSEERPAEALTLLESHVEPVIGGGVKIAQKWMVAAECHLVVGRWQQAHDVARQAVEMCAQHDLQSLTWQARLTDARALGRLGDDVQAAAQRALAAQEFATLRDRVHDPRLRGAFEDSWVRHV